MAKLKRFLAAALIIIFAATISRPGLESKAITSASAMALIEVNSGRLLFSHNPHQRREMASTTKILTAITVIENCKNLDEVISVPKEAVGIEGSSIYLARDEKISVRDLLYGLMLRSGNDAAVALAIHTAGSIQEFCKLMNQTAKKIGANNSNFANPHGLHHPDHYTTAYDLALISAYAMKNPVFREIVGTKVHQATWEGRDYPRVMYNKNKILSLYEGGNGIKTGYTKNAGRCLVSSAKRDKMEVVCVVLNCGPMFEECMRIMDLAFERYPMRTLVSPEMSMGKLPALRSKQSEIDIVADREFCYPLSEQEYNSITYDVNIKTVLYAPMKKGEPIGKVSGYLGEQKLFEVKAVLKEDLEVLPFKERLEYILRTESGADE
ncbi:MAG TPA: D-alanyl-D-alanine carboxypeptidase family protein [Clostridia bacterium]|jgi:D-alanyl-D-alanine carboxypeptidase (penicillin-binding protein 5/6)